MKKYIALLFFLSLISAFSIAQSQRLPTLYEKIEPLTKTYYGEKIKFVMARLKDNEVIVTTRKHGYTITKREAAAAGIIPPLPEIKYFNIDADIYYGIINPVSIKDIDTLTERFLSDDGGIYFNKEADQWYAEVTIPDTAVFYKINTTTMDTIGICKKPVLQVPANETIHPYVSFGDISNKLVTTDLLRQQKFIKIPPGYTMLKASFFFAGLRSYIVYLRSLNSTDLSPLKDLIDSCITGSTIVIENVLLRSPTGRLMHVTVPSIKVGEYARPLNFDGPVFQFGSISTPRAESGRFKRQKKVVVLNGYKFVSAVVYFAGAGFPNVNVATLIGNSTTPIDNLLQLCRPGTSIVFQDIKVEGKEGMQNIEGIAYALF